MQRARRLSTTSSTARRIMPSICHAGTKRVFKAFPGSFFFFDGGKNGAAARMRKNAANTPKSHRLSSPARQVSQAIHPAARPMSNNSEARMVRVILWEIAASCRKRLVVVESSTRQSAREHFLQRAAWSGSGNHTSQQMCASFRSPLELHRSGGCRAQALICRNWMRR
jgi:hypothetical protein